MIIKKFKVKGNKFDEKIIKQKPTRFYGLDLLKIIAMINIINLHINLQIKYYNINPQSLKFKPIFRLEAFSFWPVNAFGLISGIVGYKNYKFIKMIYLWFIYIFYSIFFSTILYYKSSIGTRDFILSFFPLGIRRNWYVNAYIFMYYFLPFIINSINSINKILFNKIVLHFFFIYSIYYIIIKSNIKNTNFNFIDEGYTSLWLLILYIVGGYLRRFYIHKDIISNVLLLQIYFICSLITSEYIIYNARRNKFQILIFLSYNSPIIIIQALSLIFLFSNININNKYIIKVVSFLYPLNFSVNIIHTRFFFSKIQSSVKFFNFIKTLSPKSLFFKIYGISILIYFICIFVDYLRFLIFKIFRIRNICSYIEKILF